MNRAERQLHAGAAALSLSVLADSSLEHYRGGFYNPVMFAAPAVSAVTLAVAAAAAARPRARRSPRNSAVFGLAALAGLVGFGFHLRNTMRRQGGWSWSNVFYGAPIAAPLGIHLAGVLGLAAGLIDSPKRRSPPRGHRVNRAPTLLAGVAAAGLLGTAAEAGILHFRGAFHDPFMLVPVTLPPLAAGSLLYAVAQPGTRRVRTARTLLRATAAAGVLGMAFHARGVQRSMGGWRNWSQNILVGPPIPAPPSFTGIALAGLASLNLLDERRM